MGLEPWSVNMLIYSPSKNITLSKANILIALKEQIHPIWAAIFFPGSLLHVEIRN